MWLERALGRRVTPLLAGSVIGLVGWRHAFEIFGCLGVVWAVVFYRWFRDNPSRQSRSMNAAERELLRDIEPPATTDARHGDRW